MHEPNQRTLAALGLALLAGTAACRATTFAVTAATSKESRIRLVYQEVGSTYTGIISCIVAATGDLEACQGQRVVFVEGQKRRAEP
jgi:hypothetical protein